MSRLTDRIARAKLKDSALGEELEREFKALASRRAFGLNFERHRPDSVELPGCPVRRGDKVRILPPRGTTPRLDQRLGRVKKVEGKGKARMAQVELFDAEQPQSRQDAVADLVVVAEFRHYIYPGLISTGRVERGHRGMRAATGAGEKTSIVKRLINGSGPVPGIPVVWGHLGDG